MGPGFEFEPVDVIRLKDMTAEEFRRRYADAGVPCIIEDLTDEWPARGKWSRDYFRNELGDTVVCYHKLKPDVPDADFTEQIGRTTLREFIGRLESGERIKHFSISHPVYDFISRHPTLLGDVRSEDLWKLLGARTFLGIHPMDSKFWPWIPPYPPQFFIAAGNTRTAGHYDFDASHTFHWCVEGRKSVKLFPFKTELRYVLRSINSLDLSQPVDPGIFYAYPALRGLRGWDAEILPGQTLYMPPKMWHFFKNEELSFSFLTRVRSFDTLPEYVTFANDEQGPLENIEGHRDIWLQVPRRERSLVGHGLTLAYGPMKVGTRLWLRLCAALGVLARARRRADEYRRLTSS